MVNFFFKNMESKVPIFLLNADRLKKNFTDILCGKYLRCYCEI